MITIDQETALDMERAVYHGQIYAFERVERMLQDRLESLKRTIPNGDIDHPNASRVYEIGMFLDEIHILKRQVRQAHAETLTK
jgi:hypothetical protein